MKCTATALIFIFAAALVLPKAANGVCCYLPGGEDELAVPTCADDDCPSKAIVVYTAPNAKCSESWKAKVAEGYGYIAGSPDANATEYECVFIVTGTSAPTSAGSDKRRFFSHRLSL